MIIMITRITNSSELTHCAGSGLQHLCCSVCSMPGIYVLQALEAERASASMAWRWAECQKAAAPRRRNREEMTTDRTSLHGGRPEGPWQRALLRDPDAGGGCGLPTAACRTSSILWLVARSTASASRAKSTAQNVPPEKRSSEPEKREKSGNHPSQAEKRRDWK